MTQNSKEDTDDELRLEDVEDILRHPQHHHCLVTSFVLL